MNKFLSSRIFLLLLTGFSVFLLLKLIKNYGLTLIPFIFGGFIVIATRKTVSVVEKITGLGSKTSAQMTLIVCYLLTLAVMFLLGFIGFRVLSSFASISPIFLKEKIDSIIKNINIDITLIEKFGKSLLDYLLSIISKAGNILLNIPNAIISVSVSVIASFFIVNDYDNIKNFLFKQFKKETLLKISEVKNMLFQTVSKMFVSYFLLFIINFAILFLGFLLLNVDNASVVAILISFADILPVIGIAVFLVPWAVISALNGNVYLAVGLITLLLIALIIKSILEPKVVGKNIGLHPLVTLISMYMGMQLGGILGSLLMPFVIIILIYLNSKGVLKIYKL